MSGWDTSPAPAAAEEGFTADSGFLQDPEMPTHDGEGTFNGISEENISRHANGGADDGGCRICGDTSHFARDCDQPRPANDGNCFNCGEPGHNKADCTNAAVEREFTGTCNACGEVGHRRSACPSAPAQKCNVCKEEGHMAADCSFNRMHAHYTDMGIKEVTAEEAWSMLESADKEKDISDIKHAMLTYAKAYPDVTFEELEQVFRDAEMNTYLIAKQQEVASTMTIVNLQGAKDQEFTVSTQFTNKPRRAAFAEGWPSTPEENMERLGKAGIPMDRHEQKCSNCNELGHGSKSCPEEKQENNKIVVTCANCSEDGHRARDCSAPRKTGKKGCRNCGSEEHIAKECPEPPNPENVECKNCGVMGHFSRDCPDRLPETCHNCLEEGHRSKDCNNQRVFVCRNCDQRGHVSRDCDKATDWSRVECTNCKEKGHSYKRCPNPAAAPAEEETAGGAGGDDW
ncbi:hypothetical protein LTR78_001424 [Recurvomyces mirabilis]|uniref:CCHC-type domain-containing protein n=1 Tax=Recurvomyces mirabilis TaxID=574656 RepID=A0AAE0WVL3_9PEZI|nr:hypothetical protein LTR78_001424 [Recurvomyces mirabilis]KAK5161402.1 hypothetical protein LTS14_001198 [Recurvomyces mirabilis]